MWNIENKNKLTNKNKFIEADNCLVVTRGVGGWTEDEMVKGAQLCGDEWKPDFWW